MKSDISECLYHTYIQIQLLLKLNKQTQANKRKTLWIQIQLLLKLNCNTFYICCIYCYSNTTLVKVKLWCDLQKEEITKIQIQLLLKLNRIKTGKYT